MSMLQYIKGTITIVGRMDGSMTWPAKSGEKFGDERIGVGTGGTLAVIATKMRNSLEGIINPRFVRESPLAVDVDMGRKTVNMKRKAGVRKRKPKTKPQGKLKTNPTTSK